jgi:molecular chaperone DnaK
VGAIESAVKDLEQAAHALSKHMYEAAAKAGGGSGAGQQPAGNGHTADAASQQGDNVIDAEFEKT